MKTYQNGSGTPATSLQTWGELAQLVASGVDITEETFEDMNGRFGHAVTRRET